MNRRAATLISLGVSISLLAFGIWFIYDRHSRLWYGAWGGHMGHGGMANNGLDLVMPLFWIIVLVAVVLLITGIFGSRSEGPGHADADGALNALDILKQRYARGEIDKNEYDAKRRDLREP